MKLIAFLQLRNEHESGNLIRCLDNCSLWADEIFIYDDCSTDGSQEIYKNYTEQHNIIHGPTREFDAELFHKQQLLALALKSNPDWIGWIDGDTTLCNYLTRNCKAYLQGIELRGFDSSYLHNVNMWRHPAFYRLDNQFNGLWHIVFWKNTGNLHYKPSKRLHQQQSPLGLPGPIHTPTENIPLLHYGFASERNIVKKYLTYKSYGQKGNNLERLIDEQSLELVKVPKEWYPKGSIPEDYDTVVAPLPLSYDEYKKFSSWEEYLSKTNN